MKTNKINFYQTAIEQLIELNGIKYEFRFTDTVTTENLHLVKLNEIQKLDKENNFIYSDEYNDSFSFKNTYDRAVSETEINSFIENIINKKIFAI